MQGKASMAGLVVLSSVLLVAAGLFCALFLANRTAPGTQQCLAAARMYAGTIGHPVTLGVPEGSVPAAAALLQRECG